MKLRDFRLLMNENIHPKVTEWLRTAGFDVVAALDAQLGGADDSVVLQRASAAGRLVVTHDADFGRLAIAAGAPVVGIVYLRPGHMSPEFTIANIAALFARDPDVAPPFLLVAKRVDGALRIRVRSLR